MILAFDTSNYTTSICAIAKGEVVFEARTLVQVKPGERGIRQSEAFFQHMQVLHQWNSSELRYVQSQLTHICVSTRPRPVEDSYMPVFKAGEMMATAIASALDIPLFTTSHQEGHFVAAYKTAKGLKWSPQENDQEEILFLHLSGGTTEMHRVAMDFRDRDRDRETGPYRMTCIANTADISLGQLVDRIGVITGLQFPCGAQMDQMALEDTSGALSKAPTFKMKEHFNLSGYENHYIRLLQTQGVKNEYIYFDVFKTIANALTQMIHYGHEHTGIRRILIAGGVAASKTIRSLMEKDSRNKGYSIYFADPKYACDNAFGVALIGEEAARFYRP